MSIESVEQSSETSAENLSSSAVEAVSAVKAEDKDSAIEADIEDEDPEIDEDDVRGLSLEQKCGIVEALLMASGEPLSVQKLQDASKIGNDKIITALAAIAERHKCDSAGYELVCVAEQYQFRTKARHAHFIRALKAKAPRRLSNAALETVSIVAYRQPIVKSDIERIRGVDTTPTLKTLLEKNLINIVGHQQTVGQPALYGTTDEFLKLFGLTSLGQLPTLRDLQELEKDPGEVESSEEVEETSSSTAN